MAWMLADAQRSCCVHQYMRIHKSRSNSHACGEQVASKATTGPQYQQIKLALDVHAASILVGRMIDGAKPPPHALARPAGEQPLVESGLVKRLQPELAEGLVERLKVFRDLMVTVNQAVRQLTGELEAKAPQ